VQRNTCSMRANAIYRNIRANSALLAQSSMKRLPLLRALSHQTRYRCQLKFPGATLAKRKVGERERERDIATRSRYFSGGLFEMAPKNARIGIISERLPPSCCTFPIELSSILARTIVRSHAESNCFAHVHNTYSQRGAHLAIRNCVCESR